MRGMNQLTQHLRPTFGADSRDAAMTADRFPVAGAGETLRHLRTLVRGRGLRLSVAVAVLIAAAWCGVLVPKLMGGIVDVVADGGTRPYRAHFRDPSFNNLQAVAAMCEGGNLADVIVAVASIDPVMGGVDR